MEVGVSRLLHVDPVLIKNVLIFSLGVLTWWVLGYAFSFGRPIQFIGQHYYAGNEWEDQPDYTVALVYGFIGMYILLLVKGVHTERLGLIEHLVFTFMITWFVWPVIVAWSWGYGWLEYYFDQPFLDAGGAATIHCFAGILALEAVVIIGRRPDWIESAKRHRLNVDFQPMSPSLIIVGGLLEMIALVYINALNSPTFIHSGRAFFNTWLSGGAAGLTSLLLATIGSRNQHDYVISLVKGTVSGMVIVSAMSQNVQCWEAFVHGFTAGLLFSIVKKIEDRLAIDDPLKVVPAHLLPGIFGSIGVAFWDDDTGVYHQQTSGAQIGYQLAGCVCIMTWTAIWGLILFGLMKLVRLLATPKAREESPVQEEAPLQD